MIRTRFAARCASIVVVAGACSALLAGDLDPPVGLIAPTNRIIINPQNIASLPITLSAPGSYVLSGSIDARFIPGGPGAIIITREDVTLDLNGFSIIGSRAGGDGILLAVVAYNCRILNGSIRSWSGTGINASAATGCKLDHLRLQANAIGCSGGASAIIRDCSATANLVTGMVTGSGCLVNDCIANDNATGGTAGAGFSLGTNCSLIHCTANGNGTGPAGGVGVTCGTNCTIIGCTVSGNVGGHGISTGAGCNLSDCTVSANGTTSLGGNGILTGQDCLIQHCVVNANGIETAANRHGISAGAGSTISDCRMTGNFGDGIRVTNRCFVLNNHCVTNGSGTGDGAGIHCTLNSNRIEGNSVLSNDRGIDVDAGGNLIIRNSARSNTTNYDIVGVNSVGPTVTSATIATDTSPHANYDF